MTERHAGSRQALIVIDQPARYSEQRAQRPRDVGLVSAASDLLNRTLIGIFAALGLLAVLGGWSATAKLSGAVIAPGEIVVDSQVKRVQHPTGGVVRALHVRNGDSVSAGAVLLTLENTQPTAELAALDAKLIHSRTEHARLETERDGRDTIELPGGLDASDSRVMTALDGDRRLFEARRAAMRNQGARLRERVEQVRKEVAALEAQRAAKERELALVRAELRMVEDLHKRQLANAVRLIGMQREVARFEGEIGAIQAQIARAGSQIAEIELQAIDIKQRLAVEVSKGLVEIVTQIEELAARRRIAVDALRRTEIRAPVAGVVHDLAVHTVGGVIRGGETAMRIVPRDEMLAAEVKVRPTDIDQVVAGQRAVLRLTALSRRTTPELAGTVIHVGADLTRDATGERSYFLARIVMDPSGIKDGADIKLAPGMPVEGFIETGQRTALSWLMKPISDHVARAFRED